MPCATVGKFHHGGEAAFAMLPEVFVPVNGYEDKYLISNHGRCYVKPYTRRTYIETWDTVKVEDISGRMRKATPQTTGYVQWGFVNHGEGSRGEARSNEEKRTAHSLVMEHFGPPKPSPDHIINHIDADKTNNRIDNLQWVLPVENRLHSAIQRTADELNEKRVRQRVEEWL